MKALEACKEVSVEVWESAVELCSVHPIVSSAALHAHAARSMDMTAIAEANAGGGGEKNR